MFKMKRNITCLQLHPTASKSIFHRASYFKHQTNNSNYVFWTTSLSQDCEMLED